MRELRGMGMVNVRHIPGDTNPADIFTKILSRQLFERHRKTILNIPSDASSDSVRDASAAGCAVSRRDGTGAP